MIVHCWRKEGSNSKKECAVKVRQDNEKEDKLWTRWHLVRLPWIAISSSQSILAQIGWPYRHVGQGTDGLEKRSIFNEVERNQRSRQQITWIDVIKKNVAMVKWNKWLYNSSTGETPARWFYVSRVTGPLSLQVGNLPALTF